VHRSGSSSVVALDDVSLQVLVGAIAIANL